MSRLVKLYLLGCLLWAIQVHAVGLMPTPILLNAKISAEASFDQAAGTYTYSYTVSNPAGNTGEIWDIKIDVSAEASTNAMAGRTGGFTIPSGLVREDFATALEDRLATNNHFTDPWPLQALTIVPFGSNVPHGWMSDLGIDSVASFNNGDETPNIVPGASLGGFQLISFGVPSIRDVQLIPWWVLVVDDDDDDAVKKEERMAAGQVEHDIIFHTISLGPSGVGYGSFAHWKQFRDDLARAIQLGWITDATLANSLTSQLATARASLDAKDFLGAKTLLQPMLDTISRSVAAQRSSEGYALVYLNVKSLLINTPDNALAFEPIISLTPKNSQLSIGLRQDLSVTLVDLANGSKPLAGIPIYFKVASGPNVGKVLHSAQTDAQGIATIAYTSTQTGTDGIVASAQFQDGTMTYEDKGLVIWSGGADLVIPLFTPPLLITQGGNIFYMSELTQNIGSVAAPPSVTRYYISATPIVDVTQARLVGERAIPALQPGGADSINQQVFHIPKSLPAGTYYLAACADVYKAVLELDESNNCSFNKVAGQQAFIVPMIEELKRKQK